MLARAIGLVVCGSFVFGLLVFSQTARADCRSDWNKDGVVDEADLISQDPLGGYYVNWYVAVYYPESFTALFPFRSLDSLDINNDGTH